MTKTECKKILLSMMLMYQRFFPNPSETVQMISEAWHMVLGDVGYEEACMGLTWFAKHDAKGFPPAPGQVMDCVIKARMYAAGDAMDEGAAWSLVYRAICDSNYHSEERYSELPPLVQRAVGSPAALQQMALEPDVSVTRGQFSRAYQQAMARERETATMPPDLRAKVVKLAEGLAAKGQLPMRPTSAWVEGRSGLVELTYSGEWKGEGDHGGHMQAD